MALDQLRERISEIISSPQADAEFYFLLEVNSHLLTKRADIDRGAQTELARNFMDSISKTILLNDELSLLELSGADDRIHALYRYDLVEMPGQLIHLQHVLEEEDFDVFDFSSDELRLVVGILILLGHGRDQLALYKHQYPISLLKHDGTFGLIRRRNDNRLVKVTDDILRINPKFEFLRLDGEYYIADIKALERFFGFHAAVRNVAEAGLENIAAAGIVDDIAPLADRLDDISFSRKLVRVARDSPVLGRIPNEQVIEFVKTHPALRGKFRLTSDETRMRLDTKVSQGLFLKLLNDDFLRSELTKQYYASLAKDRINEE